MADGKVKRLMEFDMKSIKDQKDSYLEWLATISSIWVEKVENVTFRKKEKRRRVYTSS